jgi:hypothetical protein
MATGSTPAEDVAGGYISVYCHHKIVSTILFYPSFVIRGPMAAGVLDLV